MEKDYKKRMVELTNALDDFCYGLRELGFGEVTAPDNIIDLMASAYRAAESEEFISKENYLSMIEKVQELEKREEKIDKALEVIGSDFGKFSLLEITSLVIELLERASHDDEQYPYLSELLWSMHPEEGLALYEEVSEEPSLILKNPEDVWDYLYKYYTEEN